MSVNKVVYGGRTLVDLSGDTVTADKLISGLTAHDKAGNQITGSIPNNGAISNTIDGLETKQVTIPAGYTSGGTVSVDHTIDTIASDQASLISQIQTALAGKVVGGGGGTGGTISTCTVDIFGEGNASYTIYYSVADGIGGISASKANPTSTSMSSYITLNDVICGSSISFIGSGVPSSSYDVDGTAQCIESVTMSSGIIRSLWQAPTVADEECYISY